MSPQKRQTDEEIYNTLLEAMEGCADLPNSKGDNIEPDDEDEEILRSIYPSAEEPTSEQAASPFLGDENSA